MLLTISTTHRPATELGFLLHKHPDRLQSFELSFGRAYVYYPVASEERCAACLLLDVDPIGMVRRANRMNAGTLGQYVNDRPYVASSLLSVAISRVLGSAMQGRCEARPELAGQEIPLEARLDVLPDRGGQALLRGVFEPLGYKVDADDLIQPNTESSIFPIRKKSMPPSTGGWTSSDAAERAWWSNRWKLSRRPMAIWRSRRVKCRGAEYLRIINGTDYLRPEHLFRLKNRSLGRKRSLALRESA